MRQMWPKAQVPARRAFTLVEMLAVLGIIVLLAALVMGVYVSTKRSAARKRTTVLIDKIDMALETHYDMFGAWPSEVGTDPTSTDAACRAVATILLQQEAIGEARREIDGQGRVVDAWGHPIHIIEEGFNQPELDIWSNGPDGINNSTAAHSGSPGNYNYGDDNVNWARE